MKNVVLLTQVLNRTEEAQPVLEEGRDHAQRETPGLHAESAVGQNAGQRQHRNELHHRVEPAVRRDRVLEGVHVLAIHLLELLAGAALPIEELQHHDPRDVLLQVGVDPGDGHADSTVAIGHAAPEDHRSHNHEGHGGQHDRRQQRAEAEHDAEDEDQHQHVAQNGHQPGGKEIVQHVHVAGHAGHQAAHRIAVVEGQVEILQVLHELAAQIEHGELAGVLHQVHLRELTDETGR